MEGNYAVRLGTDRIGKVNVQRKGLYYQFACRCRLSGTGVFRLRISCGGKQEDLGILVPIEDGFGLDTKIPAKRLGEGEPEFTLIPKHEMRQGKFIPIYPEEPFAYISKLKQAFLIRKNGQMGIQISSCNSTGQWSEPKTPV